MVKTIFRRGLLAWARSGVQYTRFYRTMEAWGSLLTPNDTLPAVLPGGNRVWCDLRDHVQRHIYFQGAYEPIESFLFSRLVPRGGVVVDAGANIGQYTLLASAMAGTVHAFEPVAKNFDRLTKHVVENRATNIRLNSLALWHERAELSFGLPQGEGPNDGSYSVGVISDSISTPVFASAVRFDDYADEHGVTGVALVKMDVEGAELSALRGMTKTLETDRPVLLMEVNRAACMRLGHAPAEVWDLLIGKLGYTAWRIGVSAREWTRLSSPQGIVQANVLFTPGELPQAVATGWDLKSCLRWARSGVAQSTSK